MQSAPVIEKVENEVLETNAQSFVRKEQINVQSVKKTKNIRNFVVKVKAPKDELDN